MKNVFLYVGLFVLLSMKGHSQGTDVVFMVDNSASIDEVEFLEMTNSIQTIMFQVLNCNENNRVAVVNYYGANVNASNAARIYIESDFTNLYSIGSDFQRQSSTNFGADYAHESLGLIGNALDGNFNSGIVSPQSNLNHILSNSLVVFLYTDGARNSGNSFLINSHPSTVPIDPNELFLNYTTFKNVRGAKFVVVIKPPSTTALEAAAAIASTDGSYMGIVESYPNDPDGSGMQGRKLVKIDFTESFELDPPVVNTVTEFICSVTPVSCIPNLTLSTLAGDNVIGGAQDNREAEIQISASNAIAANGVGIYHAGQGITLTSGFHSANSSRFRAYIADCDSGYVGRDAETSKLSAIAEETKFFSLSPNPATSSFTVKSSIDIQHITVTSFDGKTVYDSNIKGKTTSHTIDIGGYIPGFYIVNVLSQTGETQTQKLIKN